MIGEHDGEHKARMKNLERDHKRKMRSVQKQANSERSEHNTMMARIKEQSRKVEQTGRLDFNEFSSKIGFTI